MRQLLLRVFAQVIDRRLEPEHVLLAGRLADQVVEEDRALVPPVPIQLRVVGRDDDGRGPLAEGSLQELDLLGPVEEEISRVRFGALARGVRIVRLLLAERHLARDPVVLDPGVLAVASRLDVGPDVLVIEVPADVPVELTVDRVAGITVLGAPDLHGAFRVPRERGHAARGVHRRVHASPGPRHRVGEGVRIDEEETDVLRCEVAIDPRSVAALRQPDAARIPPEMHPVMHAGDLDLRADRLLVDHQGEKTVGGAASDDLHRPGVLKALEGAHQIPAIPIVEEAAQMVEVLAVMPGERAELRVRAGAMDLLVAELAEQVEPLRIARHEQLVAQHSDQGRRQRQGDPEGDPVVDAAIEHLQQRKVGLGDRLVEPILLEEFRVFRVAHVREMRVQDDRERAVAHLPFPSSSARRLVALQGSVPPGLDPKCPPKLEPLNARGCRRRSHPAGAEPP